MKMQLFKAPEPIPGERYDFYFHRLVEAFEDWANTIPATLEREAEKAANG